MQQLRAVSVIVLAAVVAAVGQEAATVSTDSIVDDLRKHPGNVALTAELAKRATDPQVAAALRELFIEHRNSGAKVEAVGRSMAASQVEAVVLLRSGLKDQLYFDEVARYAQASIAADPPGQMFLPGMDGVERPSGGYHPGFVDWCAKRGVDPDVCPKKARDSVADLVALSILKDARAVSLLRSGITATGAPVIAASVAGLAVLNDAESIPAILKACSHLRPVEAEAVGLVSASFDDPAVALIFQGCIANSALRQKVSSEWAARIAGGGRSTGSANGQ